MTAEYRDYGAFWFAQITDQHGNYRGYCQRATKAQLMAAIKVRWGKVQLVEARNG